ncbi:MAG: hypothetical protein KF688_03475 [Pirellulales bacterium]|nr:hypothetical protein [Pirellulales bacterium]
MVVGFAIACSSIGIWLGAEQFDRAGHHFIAPILGIACVLVVANAWQYLAIWMIARRNSEDKSDRISEESGKKNPTT